MSKFNHKVLTKLRSTIEKIPKDDIFKTEENEKMIDIIERILQLNNKIQSGQGLKIITPNQMLSRLPITFSSIKSRK